MNKKSRIPENKLRLKSILFFIGHEFIGQAFPESDWFSCFSFDFESRPPFFALPSEKKCRKAGIKTECKSFGFTQMDTMDENVQTLT